MVSFQEFSNFFSRPFWRAFNQPTLRIEPFDKNIILTELYENIINKKYYPSIPKYIYKDKGKSVVRSIPVFSVKDYCLYYFCIRTLEDKIAINRTVNTFGGWSCSGKLREIEEKEILRIKNIQDYLNENNFPDMFYSHPDYSFNPVAWSKYYGDFNAKLLTTCRSSQYKFVVELDIANFYDSIILDILERKIREISSNLQSEIVSLLFYFLSYWNRDINLYNKKTVGIPQDALADCSRILANFYLQDYDEYISKICRKNNCTYFRYADDQLIFSNDPNILKYIIYTSSKKLSEIGLNINQKKVEYYSLEDFLKNRTFEIFEILKDKEDKKNKEKIELFINEYLKLDLSKTKSKGLHLLNKLVTCDLNIISKELKKKIIKKLTSKNYLKQADTYKLKYIYNFLSPKKKNKFINKLIKLSNQTYHNYFHYQVLRFFEEQNLETKSIENRITQLNQQ